MKRLPALLLVVLLLTSASSLFACGTKASPEKLLEAHLWGVNMLGDSAYVASSPITLQFSAGKLGGSTGMNHYSGTYALKSGNSISIAVGATTKAAGDPEAVAAEATFLNGLAATASYAVDEESLTLFDSTGAAVVTLRAK
jgi:heat shock protein HslJ